MVARGRRECDPCGALRGGRRFAVVAARNDPTGSFCALSALCVGRSYGAGLSLGVAARLSPQCLWQKQGLPVNFAGATNSLS